MNVLSPDRKKFKWAKNVAIHYISYLIFTLDKTIDFGGHVTTNQSSEKCPRDLAKAKAIARSQRGNKDNLYL